MRVQLTREVTMQATLATPDWYATEIAKVQHDQDKNGADLDWFIFKVIDGDFRGKEFRMSQSEKFFSAEVKELYESVLNVKIGKDDVTFADGKKIKGDEFTVDNDDLKGKKVMVKVKRGEYNGKPQDTIEAFRPYKPAVV